MNKSKATYSSAVRAAFERALAKTTERTRLTGKVFRALKGRAGLVSL